MNTDKHYKTGYVSGSFDMFHIGHLNLIRRAKERCDYLIAGVLPDDVIYARKRKWPVIPFKERMEIVSAVRYVDRAEITTMELTPYCAAQKHFKFDAFFTGDDYLNDEAEEEQRRLNALGADLVFLPYTKDVSSTELNQRMKPVKEDASRPSKTSGFTFVFPFDKVVKGERIVIYGTGNIASQYPAQIAATSFCEIMAFTDTSCTEPDSFMGRPLVPPERLRDNTWYDRVVIASTKYFAEICEKLKEMGVAGEKVV